MELKMQENRQAQDESLRRRGGGLIQELARQTRRREGGGRGPKDGEQEQPVLTGVKERDAQRLQEDEQRLETHRMAQQSYQDKICSRPRSAWT
ncbi:trichoplein keratin filament-binding protein-like [Oncorhynchus kisutch]|uniref:trichoplein keratin filament-binding protein-like n=1 Tax=Oncorhynchus kisutch TaxID=8019 RepID=UPI0009A08450|nr:trichoplein keratin filament-binding protein-like [Oncorhynchus kisutch]